MLVSVLETISLVIASLTFGSLLIEGILKLAIVATFLLAVLHWTGTAFSDCEAGLKVFNKGMTCGIVVIISTSENTSTGENRCVDIFVWAQAPELTACNVSRRKPQSGARTPQPPLS